MKAINNIWQYNMVYGPVCDQDMQISFSLWEGSGSGGGKLPDTGCIQADGRV